MKLRLEADACYQREEDDGYGDVICLDDLDDDELQSMFSKTTLDLMPPKCETVPWPSIWLQMM
jgi:hypothetical protein